LTYPPPAGSPPDPAYREPIYGQHYAAPAYGPPYAAGPPTNTVAILALVFAFFFPPAGIVLGHVARKQIQHTGEAGDGLAVAGLWVGYVITSLYALACTAWAILLVASVAGATLTQ
jgi:hypothetical protein